MVGFVVIVARRSPKRRGSIGSGGAHEQQQISGGKRVTMQPSELLSKYKITLGSYQPGRYYTTCPQCSAKRNKAHLASKCLGVTIDVDGSARWGCNHCAWTGPEKGNGGAGKPNGAALTAYEYRDAAGVLRFRKVRNRPGREPRFWLEQPNDKGGWIKGTKGVDTTLLYRIDEVAAAIKQGQPILCVEGERDVDNLWRLGLAATCNAHGASEPGKRPKWTAAHSKQLAGADIVVLNDNDAAGYEHADTTCKLSVGIAKRVRRLDLKLHWPDIPKGGDISDWLALGHTREELDALIAAAPDYVCSEQQERPASEPNPAADEAELERLAKLKPFDYEKQRKIAAKALGCRSALLDKLIAAKRAELGLDARDGKQGHAITFDEPEPWGEPVDGAKLLDGIADAIRSHVVMSDEARDRAALFAMHTYLTDASLISPRLAIQSPTKRCGKTTLLDTLARLVARPLPAANTTAAVVFRVIEGHQPTLMVDEADSFLRDNEELRGVLNAGHRKGGTVLRNVGDDHEPRAFSVYGAVAIALIGELPGTLADRAVTVLLKRRLSTEAIEPFRLDRTERLDALARQAARWANDNRERIRDADPEMPDGVFNRDADNWRPLLAIAEAAGGHWPERARKAAAEGLQSEAEGSRLEMLLADIQTVFGTSDHLDRIASVDLIARLVENPDRPWAEYSRGKPITAAKLGRLLKPLGITAQVLRVEDGTARGYYRHQFEDAFTRFISEKGAFKVSQRNKRDEQGTSGTFQSVTDEPLLHFEKAEKPNNDGLCYVVTVSEGENAKTTLDRVALNLLARRFNAIGYDNTRPDEIAALKDAEADLRRELARLLPADRVQTAYLRVWWRAVDLRAQDDQKDQGASIPFMITRAMKEQLLNFGWSPDEIAQFTPERAHEILRAAAC
jgi:Protein of unknown function (DUF3631)